MDAKKCQGGYAIRQMRLSLIGMAGSGKSYWSTRLEAHGFRRFCCDELIAGKLATELKGPDGRRMKLGEWMGFPYDQRYQNHESQYLALEKEVLAEINKYLQDPKNNPEENIVVDTTGSVIYTGHEILTNLRQNTIVVLLSTPSEVREQLLSAYITNPHPMLWRDVFHKMPDETNAEALARCYPILFAAREKLYDRYADFKIDYETRHREGFDVSQFLNKIDQRIGESRFLQNRNL